MSSTRSVPFIALRNEESDVVAARVLQRVKEIYEASDFILGKTVAEFETRFAEIAGTSFAIGVNSGLDALILALKALEIGPGDEVITVANSFVASVAAIQLVGARTRFIDVGEDFNLDPKRLESVISPRTKAILPVHLTGNPCDMEAINSVAAKYRLKVIEDAAQAVGARYRGRPVGALGDVGCFSLHPLKNLHTWGDGGVITTSDRKLADRLRRARNHGLRNRDECEFFSFNSRLDSVQAAVALESLSLLDEVTRRRRENARVYDKRLKDLVEIPLVSSTCEPVYHVYQIRTPRRDALAEFLRLRGIETKVHYPIPIHLQPAAAGLEVAKGSLPITERLSMEILSLPVRESLTGADLEYICESVRDSFRN